VSNDAGDSSARLSSALDEIFSKHRASDEAAADQTSSAGDTEPYELPDIVPATADPASAAEVTEAPRLPNRSIVPEPAPAERPPTASPGAATAYTTTPASPAAERSAAAPPEAAATPSRPASPATGWSDHMPTQTTPAASQLRTPGRRPRVRRVTRVLRHVDPWSTFKIAILFNAVAYVVCLTSGVLLWRVADSTGTLDNVERWFTQFGWETFELDGGEVFHNAWIIGLFGVVAATGGAVLLVTLFNLVSDIVGGVRMTVLEEEVVERTISSTRRYVVRRPTDAAAATAASDWTADDLDDDAPAERGRTAGDDGADDQRVGEPVVSSTRTNGAPGDDGVGTTTEPMPATERSSAPTADWSVD
jgi:Transmembrane domain of unknown function (DUF3566)